MDVIKLTRELGAAIQQDERYLAFTKARETNEKWKYYFHNATSQDPTTINAWNVNSSVVSDLSNYITSSYFGKRMKSNKNAYEWYPVLALDKVKGEDYLRPTPVDVNGKAKTQAGFTENPVGLYDTWRIYVKTGEQGLKYRTASSAKASFNKLGVELEDYLTPYKLMLTGSTAQIRGAELAGDTSYGIKGAQAFFNKTKTHREDSYIDNLWNSSISNGDLGLKTGTDEVGNYIQISILNPIDDFTAMYTLSSNLYSPIPESFIKSIGNGGEDSLVSGVEKYGQFNDDNDILKFTLCLGAYYLESWQERQAIVFARDDSWFERVQNPNRYKIPGVMMRIIDTSTNEEAVWQEFADNGTLDAAGIPTKQLQAQKGQAHVYQTKGDSTFKLNINSCTQERWNELFGNDPDSNWTCKAWMSNDNFLKGLFYAIDRKSFAESRGMTPTINLMPDSYMSDPEYGVSYNSTNAHQKAIARYQENGIDINGNAVNLYGYSKSKAITCFKDAVNELSAAGKITQGTSSKPTTIKINIKWMYQTDTSEYGEEIAKYFTDAFNDAGVCGGRVKLEVIQDAVTNWEDVYNLVMMKGNFDLGFGAISGNTYNPLNFLEVLKSDNSSTFTLNWGADTSVVDEKHPIVYEGEKYSFDALWEVADHGGIVKEGEKVKPVEKCYKGVPVGLDGKAIGGDYINGAKVDVKTDFVNVGSSVSFNVDSVSIYIVGGPSYSSLDSDSGITFDPVTQKVTISAELAKEVDAQIKKAQKITEDNPTEFNKSQFTNNKYNQYWCFDVYYTLTIEGSQPQQNVISAASSKDRV